MARGILLGSLDSVHQQILPPEHHTLNPTLLGMSYLPWQESLAMGGATFGRQPSARCRTGLWSRP